MLGKSTHNFVAALLLAVAPVAVVAVSGLMLPSSARAQTSGTDTVADAARKAREAKKAAPTKAKVYTDDDVKPATPDASAQPTAGQEATQAPNGDAQAAQTGDAASLADAAGTDKSDKNAKSDKADEKAWRGKFQAQRDQIARLEKELDVLQREQDKAQVQYYPDPQKALSEGYSRKDINDKDIKIAAKKDEITQAKQALTDLEDQLRKLGGDPGWAR